MKYYQCDYWKLLTPEQKDWLFHFTNEFYKIGKYARRNDIFYIGAVDSCENLETVRIKANLNQEDILIEAIDQTNKRKKYEKYN